MGCGDSELEAREGKEQMFTDSGHGPGTGLHKACSFYPYTV